MGSDVVVIGAGALGLSTALHLALTGRSVVVIDRWTAGSQASGRAAGLFKSVQADRLRSNIARRSIERVSNFEEWAGVPLSVKTSGSVFVARTAAHRELLETEMEQSIGWGVDARRLSAGEAADNVSYLHCRDGELAYLCPEDVYIEEPLSLVEAYKKACLLHGVDIIEGEAVMTVVSERGGVRTVESEHHRIDTGAVVDAAGAWARHVGELASSQVAVAPVRHQLFVTAPLSAVHEDDPITRVIDAAVYLRPCRAGLMLGAFESDPMPIDPRHEEASFSTDEVPLDIAVLLKAAAEIESNVPSAVGSAIAEHRGGMFTMTADGRFLLGPAAGQPGVWVVTGCNGSGFSSSAALGEMLASWMTTGVAPAGAEALSPARFGPIDEAALVSSGVWQYAHYYDPLPGSAMR